MKKSFKIWMNIIEKGEGENQKKDKNIIKENKNKQFSTSQSA